MTTAAARTQSRITVGEFLDWSAEQADDARYELVAGEPIRLMAPTNIRHARIQRNVGEALRRAIATAGLPCEVFDAGPGVALGANRDECRVPDAVVTCAADIDETARLIPEPVIIVEVASPTPTTRSSSIAASHRCSIMLSSSRTAAESSTMAEGRAAAWSLGSYGKARSRLNRLASGLLWRPSIRTQSWPRPKTGAATQAAGG